MQKQANTVAATPTFENNSLTLILIKSKSDISGVKRTFENAAVAVFLKN